MSDVLSQRIVRIEKVILKSTRPRLVGVNSKRGPHGKTVADHVVRLHSDGGAVGVGWSRIDKRRAEQFLGKRLHDLFELPDGCLAAGLAIDLPLWDLVPKLSDLPLYRLLGSSRLAGVEGL